MGLGTSVAQAVVLSSNGRRTAVMCPMHVGSCPIRTRREIRAAGQAAASIRAFSADAADPFPATAPVQRSSRGIPLPYPAPLPAGPISPAVSLT